jgi:signal transduction histidine kinase
MPARRDLVPLVLYAAGSALAHAVAAAWGGIGFYSLWYPAAGLRLALLWRCGARLTPAIASIEIAVDLLAGVTPIKLGDWPSLLFGIVRPVLAYGAVVWTVRQLLAKSRGGGEPLFTAPMPFALAGVAAPLVAALVAIPQAWLRPDLTGVSDSTSTVVSLAAFTIGDLLGVLLLAPPLLWLTDRVTRRDVSPLHPPGLAMIAEAAVILFLAIAVTLALEHVGLGLQPAPVLIAVAWVGLRLGRAGAWMAIMLVATLVLPFTAGGMAMAERLRLHLGLATIVVAGYLAGSFADAQSRARADLERRDRLLFQAERLKTLRAMSVAVIHEISQPLSTLSIEARHLHELTVCAEAEIAATAALIDRKAGHLSDLVRRLRRYGGRTVDELTPLPLTVLIDTAVALARPEAQAAGVGIAVIAVQPDLVVLGQEVELAQAVVNLVRNAAQACGPGGEVTLLTKEEEGCAVIMVSNRCAPGVAAHPGMGVGTLVARAIVEAHGGTLLRENTGVVVRTTIVLPLMGDAA